MKANNYISNKEHKLLLIVAFIALILALSSFVSFSIETYNKQVQAEQIELKEKANGEYISFGIYGDWGDSRPLYRFSFIFPTLFTFLILRKTRLIIFSLFFTSIPFFIFIYWFFKINHAISTNETLSKLTVLDRIFTIATTFDYVVFLFISILLFWQISILLRMLIKTLQRKTQLP